MKPSEVLPRDGCMPALSQMNCENFIKFSDGFSEAMMRKHHLRHRSSRSSNSSKDKKNERPVSKRCSVILAETLNKESICFYDFELDIWTDKKKIYRNGFKVRCETVLWPNEETSECDDNCYQSVTKTCKSQFNGFCPTIRQTRKCDKCNADSISEPDTSNDLVGINIDGRTYIVNQNQLPLNTQDCFENQYLVDQKELTIPECKYLMNEIQNPPYEIPLSPSVDVEKSLFIKTPREKLAYCKDFMTEIWDELREKEEKIKALQQELEAMRN